MSKEDHDQILVMANGDIILNTEYNGVMIIEKNKLNKDNEPLSFTDFGKVANELES